MDESSNILECPFCGEKAEESLHWRKHYGCSNENCSAHFANLPLSQWNRRAVASEHGATDGSRLGAVSQSAYAAPKTSKLSRVVLERVVMTAQALVERLNEIHADEHYKSVWTMYAIHGGDYSNGPKYDKELAALEDALWSLCSPKLFPPAGINADRLA